MNKCRLVIYILICLIMFQSCVFAKETKSFTGTRGYIGTLPDLTGDFVPKTTPAESSSVQAIPSKDFNSSTSIKPAPENDPTFVNIILKRDKASQYVNDVNDFIPVLESLYDLIEEGGSVQLFNAKAFFLNKSIDYFRDKYADKPESQFVSYKKLMDLNTHLRSIALLRNEAQKYNPYLAYSGEGYIYNPNNIQEQLDYLKIEIEQVILALREVH